MTVALAQSLVVMLLAHRLSAIGREMTTHGLAEVGGSTVEILRMLSKEAERVAQVIPLCTGFAGVKLRDKRINAGIHHRKYPHS